MSSAGTTCAVCSTYCAPRLLSCPGCHALVHRVELESLRLRAEAAQARGELADARAAFREALTLLPRGTEQHRLVSQRIGELDERIGARGIQPEGGAQKMPRWLGALGGLGVLLWKGKFLLIFVLTKLKLLLLGLTKGGTILSMAASVGVYWALYGLPFAVGLVLSLYVHEMGHVFALRHYGIPASAPMFIPGLGAYIRLGQHPATVIEDARTGMAGPVAGLLAAMACYGVFLASGAPLFQVLAKLGAWINLFNLFPVWQLDGGRAFTSLTRRGRWGAALAILSCYLWTGEGLLLLLLIGAVGRAAVGTSSAEEDWNGLGLYVTVLAALTWLASISI